MRFGVQIRSISIKRAAILLVLSGLAVFMCEAQSVGGVTSGGASYCGSPNSGFISVTGNVGSIIGWQSSVNGGATWTNISNITASQSYNNLTQTTCYRAVVQNGAFPADTSSISCVTIYAPTVPGTLSGGGTFCGSSGAGTLTLTGNTGSVLSWQYSTDSGVTWTTIADTNTTLNYASITQNTIYQAVVQNSSFCLVDSSTNGAFVILPPTVAGSLTPVDDTVCNTLNYDTLSLTGNTGNVLGWISSVNNGVTWSAVANTTTQLIYTGLTQTTWYAVIVQNPSCLIDTTATVVVTVLSPVAVNAGTDVTIAPGQSTTLNGIGTGSPLWIPATNLSSATILNPVASPTLTTSYLLTITDTNLCTGVDTVVITVLVPVFNGMISSLFTPNGDGINDNWYIQDILVYTDNEVSVYNIYGNEVFNKTAYQNDWQGTYNGSALPDGTYFYVVTIEGKTYQGALEILKKK
jgi:gliding motility-associated-like protein